MEKVYIDAGQFLAFNDRPITEIEIPEMGGGFMRLRPLSADDREWYFFEQLKRAEVVKAGKDAVQAKSIRARLLQRAIVGENGQPAHDEAEIALIGQKSEAVIERLAQEALRISGMLPDAVKDAEKNSAGDPNALSPSA